MKSLEAFKLGEVVPREYLPGIAGKGKVRIMKKTYYFQDENNEIVLEYGIGPKSKQGE